MVKKVTNAVDRRKQNMFADSDRTYDEVARLVSRLESMFKRNPASLADHVANDRTKAAVIDKLKDTNFDVANLTSSDVNSLEAIVIPTGRPVAYIENDNVDITLLDQVWVDRVKSHLDAISTNIKSVGRIEVIGHPAAQFMPVGEQFYLGTCSVVGPNLLLTNRHVVQEFCEPTGQIKAGMRARVDFVEEVHRHPNNEFYITRVLEIGDHFDYALFEVENEQQLPPPLRLATARNQIAPVQVSPFVYVIGYPAFDSRNPADLQNKIFDNVFNVKRFSPGRWTGVQSDGTHSRTPLDEALICDYTTLGGNSGSPLFDLETGLVIGLHNSGRYLEANYAVPMWSIASRILSRPGRASGSANEIASTDFDLLMERIQQLVKASGLSMQVTNIQMTNEDIFTLPPAAPSFPKAPAPSPPLSIPTGVNVGGGWTVSPTYSPPGISIGKKILVYLKHKQEAQ